MCLLARIEIHTQQVCGLCWSPDCEFFATGANDNLCLLFDTGSVLKRPRSPVVVTQKMTTLMASSIPHYVPDPKLRHILRDSMSESQSCGSEATEIRHVPSPTRAAYVRGSSVLRLQEGRQRHTFIHGAAVKAMAFCPWQSSLLVTGGGSNDRAIRFYHAWSGACLATIAVQAQVTSLVWSNTRREVAATFGYAQPEHPFRIAVFSWPDCRQVVGIPWARSDHRALYAISYPGGPNACRRGKGVHDQAGRNGASEAEGGLWWPRTREEGCIVVASSDESIKFHEVWSEAGRPAAAGGHAGLLGGSKILEDLEGFDADTYEVIR